LRPRRAGRGGRVHSGLQSVPPRHRLPAALDDAVPVPAAPPAPPPRDHDLRRRAPGLAEPRARRRDALSWHRGVAAGEVPLRRRDVDRRREPGEPEADGAARCPPAAAAAPVPQRLGRGPVSALPRDLQLQLVREASRAPSAHNTQPARWRFSPDSAVVLFEEVSRRLPGAEPDPLAAQVTRRRTYRGRFLPADVAALDALHEVLDPAPDVTPVYDAASIAVLAAESDRASFGFLALRGYQGELYRWLRFSPRDGGWTRDGLTADCLELSRVERLVGRWLFVPAYFALLAQVGLTRPLVAEAGRTRTAAA